MYYVIFTHTHTHTHTHAHTHMFTHKHTHRHTDTHTKPHTHTHTHTHLHQAAMLLTSVVPRTGCLSSVMLLGTYTPGKSYIAT